MKRILVFTLVIALGFSALAEEGFSTLEERMTGKEFKETGLGKLTNEELSALNDWIRRHSVATLDVVATPSTAPAASNSPTEDMRGFENQRQDDPADDDIYGTIVGVFDGWKGKGTLFKLTNGMVWQQDENDSFYIKPAENVEVVIRKGFMGNWRLSVVGYGSSVDVKRIK